MRSYPQPLIRKCSSSMLIQRLWIYFRDNASPVNNLLSFFSLVDNDGLEHVLHTHHITHQTYDPWQTNIFAYFNHPYTHHSYIGGEEGACFVFEAQKTAYRSLVAICIQGDKSCLKYLSFMLVFNDVDVSMMVENVIRKYFIPNIVYVRVK